MTINKLDLGGVKLCHDKRKRKERHKHVKTIISCLCLFLCLIAIGLVGNDERETEESDYYASLIHTGTEQKYIARYATAISVDNKGVTTYKDYNGNLWEVQDAPTEIGCDARLLFDSNETFTETDDIIIDITEIN